MEIFRDERVKQVIVAVAILLGVMVVSVAIRLAGAAPGLLGEWFGMIAGFLSTPVLLEVSFFTIGLIIVVSVNHWRMKREGDEFVYLEQINEPELAAGPPDQAEGAGELQRPEVKSVRIEPAKATGREDLASRLENQD
jgi:hypothetical protein